MNIVDHVEQLMYADACFKGELKHSCNIPYT